MWKGIESKRHFTGVTGFEIYLIFNNEGCYGFTAQDDSQGSEITSGASL